MVNGSFKSDLKEPFTTYVLVYYDEVAGYSVGRVWDENNVDKAPKGYSPNLLPDATQFDEGSIIIKAAFSDVGASGWAPMEDALAWDVYTQATKCPKQANGTLKSIEAKNPSLFPVNFFQFDIIVKDSIAAPDTGWVFSTLVYDKDVPVSSKGTQKNTSTRKRKA